MKGRECQDFSLSPFMAAWMSAREVLDIAFAPRQVRAAWQRPAQALIW